MSDGPHERDPGKRSISDDRLLGAGAVGTVVAALCCFTPLLTGLLAAVGLSAAIGWLDYVLLPSLAGFAALLVYALYRRVALRHSR